MSFVQTSSIKCYIARLTYGADLLNSIKEIAARAKIRSGSFTAIGAVRKAKVSYYDQKQKKYNKLLFDDKMEIVSCIGNISELKGSKIVHAHLVLSDRKGRAFGGHLLEGTELFACELMINEFNNLRITRKYDELTGLNLMEV